MTLKVNLDFDEKVFGVKVAIWVIITAAGLSLSILEGRYIDTFLIHTNDVTRILSDMFYFAVALTGVSSVLAVSARMLLTDLVAPA